MNWHPTGNGTKAQRARSRARRQPESVADFKQRLAVMMRQRETGKSYSIVGAAPAHPCVVRANHSKRARTKARSV